MSMPLQVHRYTIAEYLEREERAEHKSEFHDGEILAMSGGTYSSSRIIHNLNGVLFARLRGHRCGGLDSNMRVRINRQMDYVYPDASIVCGPPEFDPDDKKKTTILNPTVVFEVLSESTESYDRGRKFALYRNVVSMQEYVLVSQSEPLIETFRRHPDGNWQISTHRGIEAIAALGSVSIELPLKDVYDGVEFAV